MIKIFSVLFTLLTLVACQHTATAPLKQAKKINALIIDGQNNHQVWPLATQLMKTQLESTGLFNVEIYRTQYTWHGEEHLKTHFLDDGKTYQVVSKAKTDPDFSPQFSNYDVVISNFGWQAASWPKATQRAFETYMRDGGGLVTIHAADNSFPLWPAYNEMIGLGGWGGRNEKNGPYVYFDDNGKRIDDHSKGGAGGHGKQHQFTIKSRMPSHPVMKGLPAEWLHGKDELYNRLRGPAKNMTVLATAFDDPKYNGKGRHEPVLMTINYHQGRIFHSTLGHGKAALESQSFITTFTRGTQWAATGEVTLSASKNINNN
ncbi:ThuA domain-containing protein [Thalassotalea sp. PLHSN55]|uniref:ThuA domain-containing protein n=1 Tax=Thalassotalea sp. PLHSN55 TaxID=3435888 RepID=UPI003F867075